MVLQGNRLHHACSTQGRFYLPCKLKFWFLRDGDDVLQHQYPRDMQDLAPGRRASILLFVLRYIIL